MKTPAVLFLGTWGLIPFWAKDYAIQNSTLNAKIETLDSKPSFRHSLHRRCLIPVNAFYEWQWLDAKGKNKERYEIQLANGRQPFALGGLYNVWTNPANHRETLTFTIVTTEANELIAQIHNTTHRMPWFWTHQPGPLVEAQPLGLFAFPNLDPKLEATPEGFTLSPFLTKNSD